MDVKLDNLIEKIKKEGIEEAQQTSEKLLKEAKQKASSIVDQSKKEAEKIIEDGKRQVQQFKKNAEADLKQAARNTELLLKERINKLFDNVFKKEVSATLKPEFLKELIVKIVDTWADSTKIEVVVNDADKKNLEKLLFSSLKGSLKDSITIKVSNEIAKGFRIGLEEDQVYYDFSDNAISDVLKSLLNPKLKEILDK
jgi:V/A-type H+-transporting ATPase subunit E